MPLQDELEKAIKTGKYLITISYKDVSSSKDDLRHYWITENYPQNDLMKSIDHIKNEIYEKELKSNMQFLSPTSKQIPNQQTKEFVDNK